MNDEGTFIDIVAPARDRPYTCPCCRYLTLNERGVHDICPVCKWNDDGQDSHDADRVRGGPNGSESLTDARERFNRNGSINESKYARAPLPLPGQPYEL
jgi:hypothetical protein